MIIDYLKKIRISLIKSKYRRFLKVGKGFSCGRGTIFYAQNKITIGNNVYFGRYCNVEVDAIIGNEVLIANNVAFLGRLDHAYKTVGIPVRFAPSVRDKDYEVPEDKKRIIVGDDVWIGYGSTILSGVKIGNGAIVAACSLVTKDVEPFSIVAGSPAVTVGSRFDKNDMARHKELCRLKYCSYS